jgi:hypothetical protein
MTTTPLSKDDGERFRHRVEYEDDLLNTRMNIILTMNGLAAVAVGLALPGPARFIVAIIMIIADAFWIPRAVEASRFIGALTQRLKDSKEAAPPDELFRWEVVHRPHRVGTTKFMAVVIPSLLLAGWVVAILYVLFGS